MDNLDKVLKELECPVCLNYMHTIIHMCSKGHSICQNCTKKCINCPKCKSALGENRNYSLEGIAATFVTSCEFEGCGELTTIQNIKQHSEKCTYGYSCPLKIIGCKWKGQHNLLFYHLHTHNEEELINWHPDSKCKNFMKLSFHSKQVFIIYMKYCSTTKCKVWSAQYVGPKERAKNYLFKIELFDCSGEGYSFSASQPCIPLCDMKDAFSYNKVSLPLDMVQYFKDPLKGVKCKVSFAEI